MTREQKIKNIKLLAEKLQRLTGKKVFLEEAKSPVKLEVRQKFSDILDFMLKKGPGDDVPQDQSSKREYKEETIEYLLSDIQERFQDDEITFSNQSTVKQVDTDGILLSDGVLIKFSKDNVKKFNQLVKMWTADWDDNQDDW